MKKKYILCLFAVMLFCTGFLFGNSQVDAAETDTSNVTYKYIDISTLTETQKNSIIKGKPNETLTNDYENYSFVYQKILQDQLQIQIILLTIIKIKMEHY